MAIECKRGCGFRKVNGLYLVAPAPNAPCGKLPQELHVCPSCGAGIKQGRGWQWVNPAKLLPAGVCAGPERLGDLPPCLMCPMAKPEVMGERVGLLWVGGRFYPDPSDWMNEAHQMGISRRIGAVPRGFRVGETWVLIAHPKAIRREPRTEEERQELAELNAAALHKLEGQDVAFKPLDRLVRKGVISVFRPTAIEKIVTRTQASDQEEMDKLKARGIVPVVVPDNDRDHMGSAFDPIRSDDQQELEFE